MFAFEVKPKCSVNYAHVILVRHPWVHQCVVGIMAANNPDSSLIIILLI